MSAPKLAGMVLQAGILSYDAQTLKSDTLLHEWMAGGMMKVVLEAEDTEQLRNIDDYLADRNFVTFPVIDEGRTEVRPFSFTTLSVELVDKDDPKVAEVFGQFKTLKDPKPKERYFRLQTWWESFKNSDADFLRRKFVEVIGPLF